MLIKEALQQNNWYSAKLVVNKHLYRVWHTLHNVEWYPKDKWPKEDLTASMHHPWAYSIAEATAHDHLYTIIKRVVGTEPAIIKKALGKAIFYSNEWEPCDTSSWRWPIPNDPDDYSHRPTIISHPFRN